MRRVFAKCPVSWYPRFVAAASIVVCPSRSLHVSQCALCAPSPSSSSAEPATAQMGGSPPSSSVSSSATGSAADAAASALDVATRVNKLKRLHQTGGAANQGKKQLEFTAWRELNTLTEEQINHAEGKAVALLLNSWAYFAKFWEKGKDGPAGASADQASQQSSR